MPDAVLVLVSILAGAIGGYAARWLENTVLWRELHRHDQRIDNLENGPMTPRRRWNDPNPRPSVRSDAGEGGA
jgi:hypothetical protein